MAYMQTKEFVSWNKEFGYLKVIKRNISDKATADDSGFGLTNVDFLHIKRFSLLMPPRLQDSANPYVEQVGCFLYLLLFMNNLVHEHCLVDHSSIAHYLRSRGRSRRPRCRREKRSSTRRRVLVMVIM